MDRNKKSKMGKRKLKTSLSARRAWIEIKTSSFVSQTVNVALRKESVDRNCYIAEMDEKDDRRSPQGERG